MHQGRMVIVLHQRSSLLSLVWSTNSQMQPNTKTAQCAQSLFMFLLAVLSHNQIIFVCFLLDYSTSPVWGSPKYLVRYLFFVVPSG